MDYKRRRDSSREFPPVSEPDPRYRTTNFEAMIVSEGVREMRAAHSPHIRHAPHDGSGRVVRLIAAHVAAEVEMNERGASLEVALCLVLVGLVCIPEADAEVAHTEANTWIIPIPLEHVRRENATSSGHASSLARTEHAHTSSGV